MVTFTMSIYNDKIISSVEGESILFYGEETENENARTRAEMFPLSPSKGPGWNLLSTEEKLEEMLAHADRHLSLLSETDSDSDTNTQVEVAELLVLEGGCEEGALGSVQERKINPVFKLILNHEFITHQALDWLEKQNASRMKCLVDEQEAMVNAQGVRIGWSTAQGLSVGRARTSKERQRLKDQGGGDQGCSKGSGRREQSGKDPGVHLLFHYLRQWTNGGMVELVEFEFESQRLVLTASFSILTGFDVWIERGVISYLVGLLPLAVYQWGDVRNQWTEVCPRPEVLPGWDSLGKCQWGNLGDEIESNIQLLTGKSTMPGTASAEAKKPIKRVLGALLMKCQKWVVEVLRLLKCQKRMVEVFRLQSLEKGRMVEVFRLQSLEKGPSKAGPVVKKGPNKAGLAVKKRCGIG